MSATVKTITRHSGIADQIAYGVTVDYAGVEAKADFIGQTSGGPIILIAGDMQTIVEDPARFGPKLSPEWIRNFYAR